MGIFKVALVVAALFGVTSANAQTLACLIEPSRVVELGSPVIGVIEHVNVERGQRVRKGEVVATLQARVEQRAVELAQTKMQAEAELSAAQSNLQLAKRKHERTQS
ncbi:MAG TPA: biotin/lipoyl-binding protein, partial [Burkholderiaceae bacterium]|nr:biotin/lipoyl-binding protein [Burkholderiaceae bacterium]